MIDWIEFPDYGDLMTKEEFIENVKYGYFIDYDGFGKYSNGTQMSNIKVYPSDIKENGFDKRFSHVVWFNR